MLSDGATLGRYRLVERIAAGGMAEVYLARMAGDEGLEKTVVVKTILPQYTSDEDLRKMLLDEARIGFELRHQNIAQVLDVGREQDTLFIAMEHIEGLDMAHLQQLVIGAGETLDPLLVTHIAVEVLRALDYAHRRRDSDGKPLHIIHRDISPHNILLSEEGEVKLTDFGIARARDRLAQTATGGTKGKLSYMAPEQARGLDIDHRVDLFGLAATLYEALCGEPPYSGTSSLQVLERARRGIIEPLSERCPDLDRVLVGVIDQALAQSPDDRPESATAMREPLEELLRGHASPETSLGSLVQELQRAESGRASQAERFARALLRQGTDASSLAMGTPTKPTIEALSPPPQRAVVDTGVVPAGTMVVKRSRATLVAIILVGLGAIATFAAMKLATSPADDSGDEVSSAAAQTPPGGMPAAATPDPAVPATGRADAAEKPPAVAPKPPEPEKKPRPKPDTTPKAEVKYGRVTITAWPWAEVRIDGNHYGNTPARRIKLRAGPHKLYLKNPESGKAVTKTIVVVADKHETISVELAP